VCSALLRSDSNPLDAGGCVAEACSAAGTTAQAPGTVVAQPNGKQPAARGCCRAGGVADRSPPLSLHARPRCASPSASGPRRRPDRSVRRQAAESDRAASPSRKSPRWGLAFGFLPSFWFWVRRDWTDSTRTGRRGSAPMCLRRRGGLRLRSSNFFFFYIFSKNIWSDFFTTIHLAPWRMAAGTYRRAPRRQGRARYCSVCYRRGPRQ
jgi:hypothetical protein